MVDQRVDKLADLMVNYSLSKFFACLDFGTKIFILQKAQNVIDFRALGGVFGNYCRHSSLFEVFGNRP